MIVFWPKEYVDVFQREQWVDVYREDRRRDVGALVPWRAVDEV